MRRAVEDVLQIVDWNAFHLQYPALTEDEITAFIARDESIVPNRTHLRFDFAPGHGWKWFALNKEAREVFIDQYFSRVAGGAYFHKPTPPSILTWEQVGDILDSHMKHLRDRWRKSRTPLSPEKVLEISRRVCQNARRFTVSAGLTSPQWNT